MPRFGTQEWLNAFKRALNNNPDYNDAAAEWEGDFYFIATDTPVDDDITMYLDLAEGRCKVAKLMDDPDSYSPEFEVTGEYDSWTAIITKEIEPMQAIMTGKLSLKGNMNKIMKNLKAANELVNSLTLVETEFPG